MASLQLSFSFGQEFRDEDPREVFEVIDVRAKESRYRQFRNKILLTLYLFVELYIFEKFNCKLNYDGLLIININRV